MAIPIVYLPMATGSVWLLQGIVVRRVPEFFYVSEVLPQGIHGTRQSSVPQES